MKPSVEKNIPIPKRWPFDEMKVGDSFLIPADVKRVTFSVAAKRWANKHGAKFTTRKTPEGYRCWRTE
jgi:hypothetical protein